MVKILLKVLTLCFFFSCIGCFVWYKSDPEIAEKLVMELNPNGGPLSFKKRKDSKQDTVKKAYLIPSSKSMIISSRSDLTADSVSFQKPDSTKMLMFSTKSGYILKPQDVKPLLADTIKPETSKKNRKRK